MIPARRAACNGLPFGVWWVRSASVVCGDINTFAEAIAPRVVIPFEEVSTIRTLPSSSMWLRSFMRVPYQHPLRTRSVLIKENSFQNLLSQHSRIGRGGKSVYLFSLVKSPSNVFQLMFR